MEKVIKNGKVAILYSPGYGAGWSSWSEDETKLYNPKFVEAIEQGKTGVELVELADIEYPDAYNGGAKDLEIEWIPIGTPFTIDEYDGSESIVYDHNVKWIVA